MAINKVVLNEETLIDLSNDTVSEEYVTKGISFHRPDGEIAYGELEASGGGGGGLPVQTYQIRVIDYDGTVLKEEWRTEGDIFELPEPPTHAGKVFKEWICPLEIADERVLIPGSDLVIRPCYATEDGACKFYIELDEFSKKSFRLNFILHSTGDIVTVDWGDGIVTTKQGVQNSNQDNYLDHEYAPESYPAKYTVSVSSNGILEISGGTLLKGTGTILNTALVGVHMSGGRLNSDSTIGYCAKLRYVILYNTEILYSYMFRQSRSLTDVSSNVGLYAYIYYDCTSLDDITLPLGTTISNGSFAYCNSLRHIVIPNGVKTISQEAFNACKNLLRINLPATVQTISTRAFNYCYLLHDIVLPEGLKSIGDNAFAQCTNFRNAVVPSSVTSFGANVFNGCVALKHAQLLCSITSIPTATFYGCTVLEDVTIPTTVTSIKDNAFYNCALLQNAPLHEGITSIGNYAFFQCSSLVSVEIPESVTSIGTYVFSGCGALRNVTFPSTYKSIPNYTFQSCRSLEIMPMTEQITSIGNYAFEQCNSLRNIVIPDHVTSLGTHVFRNCTGATSLTIGSGIKTIGTYMFSGCSSLTSVEIPENITTISTYAFNGCTKLATVKMPSGITSIGNQAFYYTGTMALKLVDFRTATSVPTLGTNAFKNNTGLQIVVPDELYDEWIAATNWTTYASKIYKASEVTIE